MRMFSPQVVNRKREKDSINRTSIVFFINCNCKINAIIKSISNTSH